MQNFHIVFFLLQKTQGTIVWGLRKGQCHEICLAFFYFILEFTYSGFANNFVCVEIFAE